MSPEPAAILSPAYSPININWLTLKMANKHSAVDRKKNWPWTAFQNQRALIPAYAAKIGNIGIRKRDTLNIKTNHNSFC